MRPVLAPWLITASLFSSASAQAETLAEAAAHAYASSPTLQSQRARLRALDETYVQAKAGYAPQVSLSVDQGYDRNESLPDLHSDTGSASLTLQQNIFTSGRVHWKISSAYADVMAGRQRLRAAEMALLASVAKAYVDVRRDALGLVIADRLVDLLDKQLLEAMSREQAGYVTRTDVAQARQRQAQAQADRLAARARLEASQAQYANVVGNPPDRLAAPSELLWFSTAAEAVNAGLNDNPTLLAAKFDERAASARLSAAKAEYGPTLALRADAGLVRNYQPFNPHGYNAANSVSLVLSQPLFTGGLNRSRVRQSAEQNADAVSVIEDAKRNMTRDVQDAWSSLMASRQSITANQVRREQAEQSFTGVQIESRAGLRSTLDVLNAAQELNTAELAVATSEHDAYLSEIQVLQAAGRLDVKVLSPTSATYDPDVNFKSIRGFGAIMQAPVARPKPIASLDPEPAERATAPQARTAPFLIVNGRLEDPPPLADAPPAKALAAQ